MTLVRGLQALFFANYYGFEKPARANGAQPSAVYAGRKLRMLQVLLWAMSAVYALALACAPNGSLPFGLVVVAAVLALVAHEYGVVNSARYPAFRARLDRQPFPVKLALVLFSWGSVAVGGLCLFWLMGRYHSPS